jgi:dienelactone hydrolase
MPEDIMMRPMRRRRTAGWLLAAGVAMIGAVVIWPALPYVRTAAFLVDMTGSTSVWRAWIPVRSEVVSVRDLDVPTRDFPIQARLYVPAHTAGTPVVVFPGIHAGGVDEPRLDAFSRRLAGTGLTVLSVPLPDLRAFRITRRSTDMIEDAIMWMASDPTRAPSGRVGVVGVSFSGGLALVAAGRPRLAGHIAAVVAIGSHADLPRTMRYLCTGRLPDGTLRPPNDYGAAVILVSAVDKLVPDNEVDPLRQTVVDYLVAASVASTDPATAERLFAEVRERSARLAEPARTLMRQVNARDLASLGPRLLPYIDELGADPALSPDRSPVTTAPVFLLHGADDNVIPSTETPLLADYLRTHGNVEVTWLLTPMVTHAALQTHARLADQWALLQFWRQVLAIAVLP